MKTKINIDAKDINGYNALVIALVNKKRRLMSVILMVLSVT